MALKAIQAFTKKYPILRGMITYSGIWPVANICQQTIQGREHYNFKEVARFGIFGCLYVAPTIYTWVRLIGIALPGSSIRTAFTKACIEQVTYAPFALSSFYGGMSLLEGKTWEQAKAEVATKIIPTYKVGLCYWPIVQTLNFGFVKERNRVSVAAVGSFFWIIFLSYMKRIENNNK